MRRALLAAARSLLAAGCGGEDEPAAPGRKRARPRLVDFSKKPPYVNTLDIDPATKDFLLTTNRGFWRIAQDGGKVTPVKGTAVAEGKSSPVGTFLEIRANGPGSCSAPATRTSPARCRTTSACCAPTTPARPGSPISRLGDADLHKIVLRHDRLYAFDAILVGDADLRPTAGRRSRRSSRRAG